LSSTQPAQADGRIHADQIKIIKDAATIVGAIVGNSAANKAQVARTVNAATVSGHMVLADHAIQHGQIATAGINAAAAPACITTMTKMNLSMTSFLQSMPDKGTSGSTVAREHTR
jgi:hypothetical protein